MKGTEVILILRSLIPPDLLNEDVDALDILDLMAEEGVPRASEIYMKTIASEARP